MAAHRLAPTEPLPLLCLGALQLAQALTKRVPDRDRALLAAFAFLQAPRPAAPPEQPCSSLRALRHAVQRVCAAFLTNHREVQEPCTRLGAAGGSQHR